MPEAPYFPLRWESTGDQWWYATPIDFAAANGQYHVVRELLHLDTNLLIKLTSLRRIRRLETVWDDDQHLNDVAKCKSLVAKNLLRECEAKSGHNSLIRAGYGGWLLYAAASAGDLSFVSELLKRDPLLVFGEGEYGVTDLFYAASRSKNSEVFRLLIELSLSRRELDMAGEERENSMGFKFEIMNRAIHAAARGGNLEILNELLGSDCSGSDVLAYRDSQGSTLLHSASGRNQVEVVQQLIASFDDIITSVDNQGNTAQHIAAYRGHLAVVEVLLMEAPSLSSLKNTTGDTFLHMVVLGFQAPGFRRVDKQIELVKHLVSGNTVKVEDLFNVQNNDGRTALHLAVVGSIQLNLVELLMTLKRIDLNVRDASGMTALDLIKQRPRTVTSELAMKLLASAGGFCSYHDYSGMNGSVDNTRGNFIGASPGTSFKISDSEILLYSGVDNINDGSCELPTVDYSTCLSEVSDISAVNKYQSKSSPVNSATLRLRSLISWSRKEEQRNGSGDFDYDYDYKDDNDDDFQSFNLGKVIEEHPISLRQRYTRNPILPPLSHSKRRELGHHTSLPSPLTRRRFTEGLAHGVIQTAPTVVESPVFQSPTPPDKAKGTSGTVGSRPLPLSKHRHKSFKMKLMNQYLCFGAQGLAVDK